MRIAFVGKGGSGKTTATALFSKYISSFLPTFVFDADLNQHIVATLGIEPTSTLTLSDLMTQLKQTLRAENTRYTPGEMIKTTPPGIGSKIYRTHNELADSLSSCSTQVGRLSIISVGEQDEHDVGVRCYHSKTGALELLLNHVIDDATFAICTDMTAGIDAFSSGLFAQFDLTVMLVEPTLKSVAVFDQYAKHAHLHGVRLVAIGNKVTNAEDDRFLREKIGKSLIGSLPLSEELLKAEKGDGHHTDALHDYQFSSVFDALYKLLISTPKNWSRYQENVYTLHKRNAEGWGNAAIGKDLLQQIDPTFSYASIAANS